MVSSLKATSTKGTANHVIYLEGSWAVTWILYLFGSWIWTIEQTSWSTIINFFFDECSGLSYEQLELWLNEMKWYLIITNTYCKITSINWMFVSLSRSIMCRKQKQRKESTGHKDSIKPTVIKVKLNISQHICYDHPAKRSQPRQHHFIKII